MDLEKNFLKTFLNKFKGVCFNIRFWDGEDFKVGNEEVKFNIILHKPLRKKGYVNKYLIIIWRSLYERRYRNRRRFICCI